MCGIPTVLLTAVGGVGEGRALVWFSKTCFQFLVLNGCVARAEEIRTSADFDPIAMNLQFTFAISKASFYLSSLQTLA